ncbi:type IV secretory system conjugative DNA transfer family protein [Actinomadura formosensis]|uniref:type IV secretory system conjugative DNA transfer family protein n=1 Tax=Actinomadura formosensis TaxID=60706 RepID=UPI000B00F8B8|nr:type IV secretion system DNA-binding domain-containing protein [Actinomadura formosensis]
MLTLLLLLTALAMLGVVLLARWLDGRQWAASLTAYEMALPRGLSAEDVAAFLGHVSSSTHAPRFNLMTPPPLGLELHADRSGIRHVLLVPPTMRGTVLAGLRAAMPGVRLEELPERPAIPGRMVVAAEGRLRGLDRPMAHERATQVSSNLLAALQPLAAGTHLCVQWLFVGSRTPAPVTSQRHTNAETLLELLQGNHLADGEALRAARLKQKQPLLHAVVRVAATGERAHALSVFGRAWGALRGQNTPGATLVRRALPSAVVAKRIMDRRLPILAWPVLVNSQELAGILGLPLGDAHLPGLRQQSARQLPPADAMRSTGTVIGLSTYPGMAERPLALKTPDRLRHSWVLGPVGVGKSTLLANMALQDIQAGRGVVVVDPKSDLVADLLNRIPEHRHNDVLIIDPSATDYPVGLNLLDIASGEHAGELAVDHLTHIMASLWRSSFGPRSTDVIRNSLLTLTHTRSADGSRFTLVELPELLQNPSFRGFVTSQPTVPESVRSFWLHFAQMSEAERQSVIGPSLNKLRSFTTRTALRLMFGQAKGVRLDEVFTKRRIILIPLSSGVLGSESAALVGAVIMAGLWQATQARFAIPPEKRHPVSIFADEFQDVLRLPVDLADMLAKSRGAGVGLVLAHQHLGQLSEEAKTAVLGTVRTQILFQTEYDDARTLAPRFAPLTPADLTGLGAYEIFARPCVGNVTLGPVSGRTLPLPEATTDGQALALASRQRFGRPRADVEVALMKRILPRGGPGYGLGREQLEGRS